MHIYVCAFCFLKQLCLRHPDYIQPLRWTFLRHKHHWDIKLRLNAIHTQCYMHHSEERMQSTLNEHASLLLFIKAGSLTWAQSSLNQPVQPVSSLWGCHSAFRALASRQVSSCTAFAWVPGCQVWLRCRWQWVSPGNSYDRENCCDLIP